MTCIYIYTYSSLQEANICTYHRCAMYARWNLYEMSLLLQFCLLDMYIQIQHHGQWNTMKFALRFWLLLQCPVKCDRLPCLETPFGRPVLEKNYCATQSATMLPGAYEPFPPLGGGGGLKHLSLEQLVDKMGVAASYTLGLAIPVSLYRSLPMKRYKSCFYSSCGSRAIAFFPAFM